MLIRCPECQFERQLDTDAIPANAAMATCPRCRCRFRFRNPDGTPVVDQDAPSDLHEENQPVQEAYPLPETLEGDDPLPPGAVVPRIREEGRTTEEKRPASAAPLAEQELRKNSQEEKRASFWENFQSKKDGKKDGKERKSIAAVLHAEETNVPWEEPKRYGVLMGLYQTTLRVMFNAPRFFAALPASNGKLTRPFIFYLVFGMLQTLVERMWYMMSIQANGPSITDPKLQEILGNVEQSMSLPLTLLVSPAILAVQLFFFAAVFYLMLRLVQPENVTFRTVFRVIAYSAAPTVVCVVPLVGPLVGSVWFGVCCFIGCKHALRLPWSRTGLALGPLYLIALAIGMQLIRQILSMG